MSAEGKFFLDYLLDFGVVIHWSRNHDTKKTIQRRVRERDGGELVAESTS